MPAYEAVDEFNERLAHDAEFAIGAYVAYVATDADKLDDAHDADTVGVAFRANEAVRDTLAE